MTPEETTKYEDMDYEQMVKEMVEIYDLYHDTGHPMPKLYFLIRMCAKEFVKCALSRRQWTDYCIYAYKCEKIARRIERIEEESGDEMTQGNLLSLEFLEKRLTDLSIEVIKKMNIPEGKL